MQIRAPAAAGVCPRASVDVASTVTRSAASLLGSNVTDLYLGEILTQQAVRLFIRAPLPWALWIAKLHHYLRTIATRCSISLIRPNRSSRRCD